MAANAAAFDKEGFFNTGDLGRIDPVTGCLVITGRAKDTVVLMNGENVEPEPLTHLLLRAAVPDGGTGRILTFGAA